MTGIITILCFITILILNITAYQYTKNILWNSGNTKKWNGKESAKMVMHTWAAEIRGIDRKKWTVLIAFTAISDFQIYYVLQESYLTQIKCRLIFVTAILSVCAIIDLYSKRIPNILVLCVLVCGILFLGVDAIIEKKTEYIVTGIAGFAICLILLFFLSLISKGGLGMGDVKIISAVAFITGLETAFYMVFFGMIICMGVSIYLLLFKKMSKKDTIPFGPFLYIGFLLTVLFGNF